MAGWRGGGERHAIVGRAINVRVGENLFDGHVVLLGVFGGPGRNRTCDACAFNAALYQLSYQSLNAGCLFAYHSPDSRTRCARSCCSAWRLGWRAGV